MLTKRLPALPRRKPIFFGWWVVAAGFTIQTITSGLLGQAMGAYFVRFHDEFGWSRTSLSGSYSVMSVVGGLVSAVQGPFVDRLGPRTVARAGIALFVVGLTVLSFVDAKAMLYGAFAMTSVGSALGGWVTLNATAANWFRRKRGMAMGMITAGGTVGGIAVPLVAWALSTFGWRDTARGSAVIVLLIGMPLTQFLRTRPEDYGMAPDGEAAPAPSLSAAGATRASPSSDAVEGFTAAQAVRTPAFWFISIGHCSAVILVSVLSIHLIPHLVQDLHFSLELAGTMLALVTAFSLIGQVVGGVLADRMDKRRLAMVGMTGHVLGMLSLALGTSLGWVLLFTVLHGLAWGVRGPLMSSIRADYFGRKALGTILGLSMLVLVVGQVGGPLLSGFLVDQTGNYRLGFMILGALAGVGSLAFLAARPPALPGRTAPAAAPASGS